MRHDDGGHRFPLRWGAGEGGREQTLQPRPKGRCWVADEREDGGSVLALHSLPSALTLVRLLEVSSLLSPSSPLPSSQKRPQEVLVPGLQPRSRGATSTPLPPSPGDFLRRPCLPASLGAPSRARLSTGWAGRRAGSPGPGPGAPSHVPAVGPRHRRPPSFPHLAGGMQTRSAHHGAAQGGGEVSRSRQVLLGTRGCWAVGTRGQMRDFVPRAPTSPSALSQGRKA